MIMLQHYVIVSVWQENGIYRFPSARCDCKYLARKWPPMVFLQLNVMVSLKQESATYGLLFALCDNTSLARKRICGLLSAICDGYYEKLYKNSVKVDETPLVDIIGNNPRELSPSESLKLEGKPYVEPSIKVNDPKLQAVDKFTYLGSTLSRAVHIDDAIDCRIAKTSAAFGRLRLSVWKRRGIHLETKISFYRAVVIITLLYACETWTVYARHAKRLNHFHMTCLRKLMNIKWQDKIPDTDVLTRAKLPSIYAILQRSQVRWTGHICRMPETRIPKQLLFGELTAGRRFLGGQWKRVKDSLKASLKTLGIEIDKWEELAKDRTAWKTSISTPNTSARPVEGTFMPKLTWRVTFGQPNPVNYVESDVMVIFAERWTNIIIIINSGDVTQGK
ncbi:uncharacterized protein LOC128558876 [Mercenaria mercenaria]|uniref:uncharacterized protein LOC128558876 n=1 Tax=Mercenaria mercenaria TaxID=6596 RepID=UPI00234F682B|nr:uncharacterized protein LOC128558876 [Mercenaria mercenaria]